MSSKTARQTRRKKEGKKTGDICGFQHSTGPRAMLCLPTALSPSCPHTHTHTHSHTNTHSHTLSYTHSHTHTHFLHSARLPTRLEPLEGRERAPALCSAHTSPRRGSAVPQTGKWSVLSPHQPSDSCSDISFVRGNASPSLLSFFKVMVVF